MLGCWRQLGTGCVTLTSYSIDTDEYEALHKRQLPPISSPIKGNTQQMTGLTLKNTVRNNADQDVDHDICQSIWLFDSHVFVIVFGFQGISCIITIVIFFICSTAVAKNGKK